MAKKTTDKKINSEELSQKFKPFSAFRGSMFGPGRSPSYSKGQRIPNTTFRTQHKGGS